MFGSKHVSLISILGLLCLKTAAQNNYFINPPLPGPDHQYEDNNVYELGSSINLEWKSNFTTISLVLWQNDNSSYDFLINSQPLQQTLQWNVNVDGEYNITAASLPTPGVFFFEIWEMIDNDNQIGGRFSSHYFNLTGNQGGSATTSSTSISTPSATSSATSTASTTSSSSSGLSSGAKIGIGVGVGVGVACLLVGAAIALFFWRKSKKSTGAKTATDFDESQRERSMEQAAPSYFSGSPGGGYTQVQQQHGGSYYENDYMAKSQMSQPMQPGELSAQAQMHELPSAPGQSYELPGSQK